MTATDGLSTRQAARRQRLLDAALELLETRHYERISVREVAESASVALATLYHYFPSKEHLFGEALVQWASTLRSDVTRRPLRGTTPAARLEEAFLRSVRAFERRPQLAHLIGLFQLSDEPFAREVMTRLGAATERGLPGPPAGPARGGGGAHRARARRGARQLPAGLVRRAVLDRRRPACGERRGGAPRRCA